MMAAIQGDWYTGRQQSDGTHTPGPWTVDGYGDHEVDIYAGDVLICAMRDGDTDPNDTALEADARLIAAAPELLAALRVADDALDFAQAQVDSDKDADKLRAWRKQIQDVLSKTEGGE